MSETLPEGWAFTTLGDLSMYVTSGSRDWSQFYSDHGALFIRTQDINQNRLASVDEIARVDLPKQTEGKRTLVRQGDLLITITGANVGKCAHVDIPLPEAYVSQSVALVRLAKGFSGRFVHRQLISPGSDDEHTPLQQSAYGVGRPVLNLDNVRDAPIVLAPFSEQDRIVAKIEKLLSEVDSARNNLSRVPAILKRFRQAVLAAACSGRLTEDWREGQPSVKSATELLGCLLSDRTQVYEDQCRDAQTKCQHVPKQPDNLRRVNFVLPEPVTLYDIPETWTWVSVHDVISFVQYGTSVKSDAAHDKGVPILRMGNIQDGRIDLTSLKYISRETENLSEFTLTKGDILFNRTNSPELVGKTAVYDTDLQAVFASYLIRLRCDERIARSSYVASWISSPWGRWWARTVRTDGVSQSNINASILRTMPLPLPPIQEQEEIAQRIDASFKLADTVEEYVSAATVRSDELTQSILAKAFRGELVPTEAELARREGREYEPASVLLERIKKERSEAPKIDRRPRKTMQVAH